MKKFSELKKELLETTKQRISDAVSPGLMIIQAMNTADELTKVLNSLAKRLREWHAYALPEMEHNVDDNEAYCRLIATQTYDELKEEFAKKTMGNVLNTKDMDIQIVIAHSITENYKLKEEILTYIESLMEIHMPNILILAGTNIGARLLVSAGSIKKLAMLPASTIQMMGAEKALFRHLRSGAKPPKHGYIINHSFVAKAGREKGRAARMLADKLAICAKLDYFKGEVLAPKFRDELEKKF